MYAQGIKDAQAELAYEISQDTDQETSGGEENNLKRAKGDEAEVEFFRPSGKVSSSGTRFPTVVWELIRCFISGASITTITPYVPAGGASSFSDPPNFSNGGLA